ncbi:DUF4870 family protein [Ramlibacter sp. AN1133]|uniref:DUF4870 family protein n=1 Tax=Ramlibacter sp. AN1133 TaxID=3133429 RepID=UPI0030C532C2
MAETDFVTLEDKRSDRSTMHVLYGLHTVAPFSLWTLSVIALIVNYVKKADEADRLYAAHHKYMIRTFWWTMVWLVITAPLFVLIIPGYIAWTIIGAWYIYRYLRGWLRFNDNRFPE